MAGVPFLHLAKQGVVDVRNCRADGMGGAFGSNGHTRWLRKLGIALLTGVAMDQEVHHRRDRSDQNVPRRRPGDWTERSRGLCRMRSLPCDAG